MTLYITLFTAIVVSAIRVYSRRNGFDIELGLLTTLLWGATLMWAVDLGYAVREEGASAFVPDMSTLASETALGMTVIVVAIIAQILHTRLRSSQESSSRPRR